MEILRAQLARIQQQLGGLTASQKMFVSALQAKLEFVIRRMKGVASADVFLDTTRQQRVEGRIEPSASVAIFMRDGATLDKRFPDAIADLVAGSSASLSRSRIKIV